MPAKSSVADGATIGPRELLRKLRVFTSDAAKEVQEFAEEVGPLSCRRGCDNCCRQKVIMTTSEGLGVYLYLRDEGRWSGELEARLAEEDAYATRTSHDEWWREKRACPFLKDGECGVYPVRPLGCISTFSTNDPKFCGATEVEPGQGQMQIHAPEAPAMWTLGSFLTSLDNGIPGSGYMTLAGAVLAGARLATGREPRRALALPIGRDPSTLIERFDAAGKSFDFHDS